jgi:hypothetical protein
MKGKTMTKEAPYVPPLERYRLAVAEFRAAYGALAASDRHNGRHGFGPPINVVDLRHSVANPNEGGSLEDDVKKFL